MRPQDILMPDARRPVLQAGRLPHRPGPPGRARRDHARPFRPRPRRPRRGAGDAGNPRHRCGCATARISPRCTQAVRYGETLRSATSRSRSSRPATCSARRRSRSSATAPHRRLRRLQARRRSDLRAVRSRCNATSSSPRRPSACRSSAMPTRARDRQAAALGRAVSGARPSRRRLFARQGAARDRAVARGRLRRADLSARRDGEDHAISMQARGIKLGDSAPVTTAEARHDLAGTIALAPPSAFGDMWTRRFPDPVTAFASGWMRVRARARQHGVELPLVISDHADWDELTATIADRRRRGLGHPRPRGRARALVRRTASPRARSPHRLRRRGGGTTAVAAPRAAET